MIQFISHGNIGNVDARKRIDGGGFLYGLGIVKIEALGQKINWNSGNQITTEINHEIDDTGIGVLIKLRYGTKPLTEKTNAYFQANCEIAIATDVGYMLKAGYETGFLIRLSENFVARPYIGGYFWPTGDLNSDFGGFSTDFGHSTGFQMDLRW